MRKKRLGCFPVLLFLISIILIVGISFVYIKDDQDYDRIREAATNEEESKDDEGKKKKGFSVDWDKLPDECVFWLRFHKPKKISYPVMQADDNDFYLHKNIDGDYAYAGSIFMDYHNNPDLTDQNTIIFGHNMANGTMFGQLKKYNDKDYWRKNQYFYIYHRDGKRYKYQIYNVVQVKPNSEIYTYEFGSRENMDKYIEKWTARGVYDTGIIPTATDNIVSLSTCSSYGTKRMVVQGMLIEVTDY